MSFPAKTSWRIPMIDGLRALACLMVFSFHVWEFAGRPALALALGGTHLDLLAPMAHFTSGVELFMVLSGFCLFWPLCKSPEALANWDPRDYALRRVRRIVPPYYMAIVYSCALPIVLVALFRLVGADANWQPLPTARQLITHLFFIHTLFVDTWAGITGAFWSLGLEAQFYLAFPLVVLGFRRFRFKAIVAMVAISIGYRIAAGLLTQGDVGAHFVSSIFFLGRWMQFAAGMAAAWIVAQHWRSGTVHTGWIGSALLAAALGLYVAAVREMPPMFALLFPTRDLLLAAAFGTGIVALCITDTPARMLIGNRAMTALGFISYSVFLLHQPTAWYLSEAFRKVLHIHDPLVLFALLCTVGLGIIVGISWLFFLAVEKPFLNTPRRAPRPATTPIGSIQPESISAAP